MKENIQLVIDSDSHLLSRDVGVLNRTLFLQVQGWVLRVGDCGDRVPVHRHDGDLAHLKAILADSRGPVPRTLGVGAVQDWLARLPPGSKERGDAGRLTPTGSYPRQELVRNGHDVGTDRVRVEHVALADGANQLLSRRGQVRKRGSIRVEV